MTKMKTNAATGAEGLTSSCLPSASLSDSAMSGASPIRPSKMAEVRLLMLQIGCYYFLCDLVCNVVVSERPWFFETDQHGSVTVIRIDFCYYIYHRITYREFSCTCWNVSTVVFTSYHKNENCCITILKKHNAVSHEHQSDRVAVQMCNIWLY